MLESRPCRGNLASHWSQYYCLKLDPLIKPTRTGRGSKPLTGRHLYPGLLSIHSPSGRWKNWLLPRRESFKINIFNNFIGICLILPREKKNTEENTKDPHSTQWRALPDVSFYIFIFLFLIYGWKGWVPEQHPHQRDNKSNSKRKWMFNQD